MSVTDGLASGLAHFADRAPLKMSELAGVRTLTDHITLTEQSRNVQVLDPGGSARNVTLPAEAVGLFFWFVNTADNAENLVVKNDGGDTVATVAQGEECVVWCNDSAAWAVLKRGAVEPAGEGQILTATGTIAMAAVRTLNATPVTVIAAPAAGKFIEVLRCHWFLDFATAAYDAAAAGDTLNLKYTDASGAAVVDAVAGNAIGSAAADYHTLVIAVPEVIPVVATPIVAHIASGEWYSAAGDSPLKYCIDYRVRTLAL